MPVPVLVVRHAVAVPRRTWAGPDEARPLDERGRRQADALVHQLAGRAVDAVRSSPAVRCVATVGPLAAACGLDVDVDDDVAEGTGARAVEAVWRLVRAGGGAVVCTHGDVVGDLLTALVAAEADLDHAGRCQKGSTWVLEQGPDYRLVGRYVPPPA